MDKRPPLPKKPNKPKTRKAEKLLPDISSVNRNPPVIIKEQQFGHGKNIVMGISSSHLCIATGRSGVQLYDLTTMKEDGLVTCYESKVTTLFAVSDSKIWAGSSEGHLFLLDLKKKLVIDKKFKAHSGSVKFISRFRETLLSCDDEGNLIIWSNIESFEKKQFIKVLQKPVGICDCGSDGIWATSSKNLQIIRPDFSSSHMIEVSAILLNSGTITDMENCNLTNNIFLSFDDGNVAIWDTKSQTLLSVYNISYYKILKMILIGEKFLWITNTTRKIIVIDISDSCNWIVKKEWEASSQCISNFSVLDSKEDTFVASSSTEGLVSIWSGSNGNDELVQNVKNRISEYSTTKELSILICSFNVGDHKILKDDSDIENLFGRWTSSMPSADLIILGLQEIHDLESKRRTAKSFLRPEKEDSRARLWTEKFSKYLAQNSSDGYYHLEHETLVGLYLCIFVKRMHQNSVFDYQVKTVKTGMGGMHGNKGGILARLRIDDTPICIINCHLAAGISNLSGRNSDAAQIIRSNSFSPISYPLPIFRQGGDGSQPLDYEQCFVFGDLNYRIEMPRKEILEILSKVPSDYSELLNHDQLTWQLADPASILHKFKEADINFHPTYKYSVGKSTYKGEPKFRAPAWCDRILVSGDAECTSYNRFECFVSDHRPISGVFKMKTRIIDPGKYKAVLSSLMNE